MKKFSTFFNEAISESIVDIGRNTLDPNVFTFFDDGNLPLLKDGIKKQISVDVQKIADVVPVDNFFVIGSVLTRNFTSDCDIDVTVEVDAGNADQVIAAELMHLLKKLNGKRAVGTLHPINYHIETEPYDLTKADAAYDVSNERWMKAPREISPDVMNTLAKFQTTIQDIDLATGKLRRDIVDFEKIRSLKPSDVKHLQSIMRKKLEDVQESIVALANQYQDIKLLRKMAFDRDLTPEEIRVLGSKNKMPENVIYKLLEKYYYIDFIKRIKKMIEQKDLAPSDVDQIKQLGKEMWG